MCNGVRTAMLIEEWEIKSDAGNFHSSFLECGSFLMFICGWNVKVHVSSILEFISMPHMRSSALSVILRTSFFLSYLHKRHNVKVKVFLRWQWPKKSIKSKAKIPPQKRIKFFMEKRANSRNSITMMFWCSIDFPNCVSHPNIVFLHTNNNLLNVGGESRRVWMFHQWNEEESGKKTFWRSNSNLIVRIRYCQTLGALPWVMRNSIAFFYKVQRMSKISAKFQKTLSYSNSANFSRNSVRFCEWKRLRSLNNIHG